MVKFVISDSENERLLYRLTGVARTAPKIYNLQIEITNTHDWAVVLDSFIVSFMNVTPSSRENPLSVSIRATQQKQFLNMNALIQLITQYVDPHHPNNLSILSKLGFIGMEKKSKDPIRLNVVVAIENENGPDIAIVFNELNFRCLPDQKTHAELLLRGEDAVYRHVFKKIRYRVYNENHKMCTTLFNLRNEQFLELILKNISLWDIQYLFLEDFTHSRNRSAIKDNFLILKKNYDESVEQLNIALNFVMNFIKRQCALDADISIQIPEQLSAYSVIKLLGEIGYEGDFTRKIADLDEKKEQAKAEIQTEFILNLDLMKKVISDKITQNILSTNMIKAWALLTKRSVKIWSNQNRDIHDKETILQNTFTHIHGGNPSPLHFLEVNNIHFHRMALDYLIKRNLLGPILPEPSAKPICDFDFTYLRHYS